MEMDTLRKLEEWNRVKLESYAERFSEAKEKRAMRLREDPSVEIIFLNPEEIEEEYALLEELPIKDDAVFTVKAVLDEERKGKVAEEILLFCEAEEVEPVRERDGKLSVIGAIMFCFYASPEILGEVGGSDEGGWTFELFFPHSVKRSGR